MVMATEEVTTNTLEAPAEDNNLASSFGAWTPGEAPSEQNVSNDAPASEGDGNTNQEPPAEEPATGWWTELGEFKDADSFKGHYKTSLEERTQLAEKVKELEGKSLTYSADYVERIDAYTRQLGSEGITDPKEVYSKVLKMVQESAPDYYLDMAKNNPIAVIERSLRDEYAATGATEQDIERIVRRETRLPQKPNLDNFDGEDDPAYVEALEAYSDAETDLRLKALSIAKKLEASREKVDFKPKGVLTPEEREARVQDAAKRYNERIPALEAKIPTLEVAGHKLDFPLEGEYLAAINEAIQNPAVFLSQFYTETGEPDAVAIGTMKATIAAIPLIVERAVKQAVHNQTEMVDGKLRNPNANPTYQNGGGSPNIDLQDVFDQAAKARKA